MKHTTATLQAARSVKPLPLCLALAALLEYVDDFGTHTGDNRVTWAREALSAAPDLTPAQKAAPQLLAALDGLLSMVSNVLTDEQLDRPQVGGARAKCAATIRDAMMPARAAIAAATVPEGDTPAARPSLYVLARNSRYYVSGGKDCAAEWCEREENAVRFDLSDPEQERLAARFIGEYGGKLYPVSV